MSRISDLRTHKKKFLFLFLILRQCSRFLRSGMTKEIGQLEFRSNFHILVMVL